MTGKFYIDGQDAYSLYGVSITEGRYNGLLSYPPLKNVESNDWAEDDGSEFDLSAPVLDSHEFDITFAATGRDARFGAFLNLIADKAYHQFDFREIGKTYNLRLTSQGALDAKLFDHYSFTLKFADDFPLDGYQNQEPSTDIVSPRGYELDARSLSEYGLTVLEGSLNQVLKSPAVKKNLLLNFNSRQGAIYDCKYVKFNTKDVNLNLLMRARNASELWRNYNTFLHHLTRKDERMLYVEDTGYEYPCYYKSASVVDYSFTPGQCWIQFDLTLVFTSFRVEEEEYLLADEEKRLIITEDEEYAINLSIYAN